MNNYAHQDAVAKSSPFGENWQNEIGLVSAIWLNRSEVDWKFNNYDYFSIDFYDQLIFLKY